jgi:hypothetical protein
MLQYHITRLELSFSISLLGQEVKDVCEIKFHCPDRIILSPRKERIH